MKRTGSIGYGSRVLLISGLGLGLALVGSCTSDACKDGAFAKDGMCMPTCPDVTCGDKVCSRYFWPDGSWNKSLRCETAASCPKDCGNADLNLSEVMLFAMYDFDSNTAVPNPAENVSISLTCSGGGQVVVAGTNACYPSLGMCTHDFIYTFSNCAYTSSYPQAHVTFVSGSLEGAWSHAYGVTNGPMAYVVTGQVNMSGTVSVGDVLDQTAATLPSTSCSVSFTDATTGSSGTAVTTGTMCGRTIVSPIYSP